MSLPDVVRIGCRDYRVEEMPPAVADGDSLFGNVDVNYGIIRIALQYGPQRAATTLIHEVLHGCYHEGDLREREPEEKVVTVLSLQLAQVFRDNPAFVEYLLKNLG